MQPSSGGTRPDDTQDLLRVISLEWNPDLNYVWVKGPRELDMPEPDEKMGFLDAHRSVLWAYLRSRGSVESIENTEGL